MVVTPGIVLAGRYRVLRTLARGGMGEVYFAEQLGADGVSRPVVIKVLRSEHASDPAFATQFLNEAKALSSLSHPNIVQVIEFGEHEGGRFLAMEYVHGKSLRALLSKAEKTGATVPWEVSAWICAQVLHALSSAHALKGSDGAPLHLVHRDVSPENVLIGLDGSVKLADFGIARGKNLVPTTQAGEVRGKLRYMAPEQQRGEALDARTDLFATGLVLAECFERAPAGTVPPALKAAAARASEPEPALRWPRCEEMAAVLDVEVQRAFPGFGPAKVREQLATLFGDDPAQPERTAAITVPLRPVVVRSPAKKPRSKVLVVSAWAAVSIGVAVLGAVLVTRPPPEVRRAAASVPAPIPTSTPTPAPAPAAVPVVATPPAPPPTSKPSTGLVDLRVNPWADVYLGGQRLGTTPLDPLKLPAGKHVLLLKNPPLGSEREVSVNVAAGQTVVVPVDLMR